ncbi:alpha/beta hydrolase [Streptomyces sp. ventii]|uniref:Alpha/beta hydrolase n=1 Tax=Streptomyces spiramenti TaxID=2720606 RepID=A0ABX1AEQ4_9ACTN|nr:alpha/beta hydrolase [Streptomyces spiramenti]
MRTLTRLDGRALVVADHGGAGRPLLALHGTFGRGTVFDRLAADLAGVARVVAPDQRGHGHSDSAELHDRASHVADAAAVIRSLDVGPVVVLGHSLGGITAYQLAARHPELVAALVVEDVGPVMRRPEIAHPVLDVRGWPRSAPTRGELAERIEAAGVPDAGYFLRSAVERDGAAELLFDWEEMMAVQRGGCGDWWEDWLGSSCPALVLRGAGSTLLPAELARRMCRSRPGTALRTVAGAGHWVHDDAPEEFARAVADFLAALPAAPGSAPGPAVRRPPLADAHGQA